MNIIGFFFGVLFVIISGWGDNVNYISLLVTFHYRYKFTNHCMLYLRAIIQVQCRKLGYEKDIMRCRFLALPCMVTADIWAGMVGISCNCLWKRRLSGCSVHELLTD